MSSNQTEEQPKAASVSQALNSALGSSAFANSPKLMGFLSYIVEEELAGRGKSIRGKSIATDVYERQLDEAGSALNLVRVEARRLRRVLEEYYADEGRLDPVHIKLDTGTYRPRFRWLSATEAASGRPQLLAQPEQPNRRTTKFWSAATIAICLVFIGLVAFVATAALKDARRAPVAQAEAAALAELAALRERSISSVQAANLAEQSRGFFFPLFDMKRQEITLEAFRHVIDLDPDLPQGYAGAAQVLALLAFMSEDQVTAESLHFEAQSMANRAIENSPTDGWAQAALGWVFATGGETERALRHAEIARDLSAEDGHVQDLVALTALVANAPALMAEVSDPERVRFGSGRFGANSLWGTSQLMLGNYAETIEAFSTAAERGLPVSAPSLFLLATAYHETADTSRARQTMEEMATTWPGFPASEVASRFFSNDPDTLRRVLATLNTYSLAP